MGKIVKLFEIFMQKQSLGDGCSIYPTHTSTARVYGVSGILGAGLGIYR